MSQGPTWITFICQWPPCSKPFQARRFRLHHKPPKFCSHSCSAKEVLSRRDTGTLADHFWAKVTKGLPHECWLWQASKAGKGYGTLYVPEQKRTVGAHIVSWFLHFETWPSKGTCVLHNCPTGDNPACVNPAHLWLGTHADNSLDCSHKGRNPMSKLTKDQWDEALRLHATGQWSQPRLAARYGVSHASIGARLRLHYASLEMNQKQ
jgi:hypothetical protein